MFKRGTNFFFTACAGAGAGARVEPGTAVVRTPRTVVRTYPGCTGERPAAKLPDADFPRSGHSLRARAYAAAAGRMISVVHGPEPTRSAFAGRALALVTAAWILAAAPEHLNPGGGLLCEIGTGREILEADFPDLPFLWLDTEESEGEVFWLPAEAFGVM